MVFKRERVQIRCKLQPPPGERKLSVGYTKRELVKKQKTDPRSEVG